jgi:uncharacterized protein (TIGR00269 family)
MHLCEDHFLQDFESKAKRAIRTHRWLESADRIAVALSGGKDSSALLKFLVSLTAVREDLSLIAITIDEGIAGYRDVSVAERIAASFGVEWITASFSDEYGTTMDQIVETKGDRLSCSSCGVLRRRILNRVAREAGATKLALGHNLDDEAQSVLMNALRGDEARLIRGGEPDEEHVPRIKPFISIPEREVALYAHMHLVSFEQGRCPYSHNALRADVRKILNWYSWRHPSTRYSLIRLGEGLAGWAAREGPGRDCRECGEPRASSCTGLDASGQVNLP